MLWMVEDSFRTAKSIMETRPIFHKCDETIRGHVFCSFLALVLKRELEIRMEQKGLAAEWAEVIRGLDNLQQAELSLQGSRFLFRSQLKGRCLSSHPRCRSRPPARPRGNRLKRLAPRRSQM